MQGWYEFGYNCFPSGEQRRRFYRQRDDPCDSEEERDYDDETNDRPIYYYPLRASEEGSRASDDSASSSVTAEEEEEDKDESFGDTTSIWNDGQATAEGSSAGVWRRRRPKRSRRTRQAKSDTRCLLHTTLYEDMPAWYGASTAPLTTSLPGSSAPCLLSLQHGGAPCAAPFAVSNQVSLWCWLSSAARHGGAAREEAAGSLRCARVPHDAGLAACLRWDRLHPTLRLARTAAVRPPPRIGHCCVSLTSLDASLVQFFLTDHRQATAASHTPLPASASDSVHRPEYNGDGAAVTGLVSGADVELHVSVVLGGASRLAELSSTRASGSGAGCRSGSHSPTFDSLRGGFGDDTSAGRTSSLDSAAIPRADILSHPALCLTVLQRAADGEVPWRHHTVVIPLDTPALSILAPRAFATLTPWADAEAEATAVRSFAYLGGTENGRDPLAFLELEVFRLHLETWAWSSSPITTYGAKPAPRFGHSANMVDSDGCLLMFGGVGCGHIYLNDLHVLDVRTRVWREVFIPFNHDVPRRAFHMSAVLNDAAASGGQGRRETFGGSRMAAFTRHARAALEGDSLPAPPNVCGAAPAVEDEEDSGDDVWSSSVTSAQSRGTLLLLGGECDGGPVAPAWTCTLCNGKWRRVSFPLRTQLNFFHVARACAGGDGVAQVARRQLSRAEFRVAVEALVERAARAGGSRSESERSSATIVEDAYVAVCHGSLAQLLTCPASARQPEQLLIVGGSRGPPVSVATQLALMGTSLKDAASLWLLAAAQPGRQQEQQRGCSLSPAVQQRVPNLAQFFFRNDAALSRAMRSVIPPWNEQKESPPRRLLSDADARSNRLVGESVLDSQLMEWLRLARKRLRDSP